MIRFTGGVAKYAGFSASYASWIGSHSVKSRYIEATGLVRAFHAAIARGPGEQHRESRRRTERLLRCRERHIDAPRIHLERFTAHTAHAVDDDERVVFATRAAASSFTGASTAVEVSTWVMVITLNHHPRPARARLLPALGHCEPGSART